MSPKQHERVSGTVTERLKVKRCENFKNGQYVRSGIRTHASIRRPERPLPLCSGKVFNLESGALDRSAILTTVWGD